MSSALQRRIATATLVAVSCMTLVGFGRHDNDDERDRGRDRPPPLTVPKAKCGPGDRPETALQGQVPAALRAAGFKGFNCNLELIGQSRGDGANWQTTQFRETDWVKHRKGWFTHWHKRERVCAYHGTASPTLSLPNRSHMGVRALDVTDLRNPVHTASLTTTSMLDPWESLKVNERRQLLAADNGQNGGGGPEIDIYDISDDCRFPQLLASVGVGLPDGSTGVPATVTGHEGAWAPDGLTYYGGDLRQFQYYAVDTTDPSRPKLITTFKEPFGAGPPYANTHGMSISDDGMRAYFVTAVYSSVIDFDNIGNPNVVHNNGLIIADVSDVQKRRPNPQIRMISKLIWKDGSGGQHTINVKIKGKPYVIYVDEGGSGGNTPRGWEASCAAGLPAWPFARIIDIKNEKKPKIVSKLMLEMHDPANCGKVLPDLVGLGSFTYGSHYCSVDNRKNETTLACGYFNSGIRVFDIRDPERPREIAYFNPPGTTTSSPGSNHNRAGGWVAGGPDWCSAQVHLDAEKGTLWTTCQDNGLLTLKFRKGVWPFPQSSTPDGQQN